MSYRFIPLCIIALAAMPAALIAQFRPRLEPPATTINKCDFCLAAQGISPLESGASGVRGDVRYLRLGTLYTNGSRAENVEHEVESHLTQQYSFIYAATSDLTLSLLVPIAERRSEMIEENGEAVTGHQFGLADMILLGRYKLLEDHTLETTTLLSASAGVKLPTGRTNGTDSRGEALDAHIQLGSGSTDFLLGVGANVARDRFALSANLLGAITGKGANNHTFGNNLNYDATLRYRVYPSEIDVQSLMVGLGVYGELRGQEREDGELVDDSGGNVIYVGPSAQYFASSRLSFEAGFHYPVVHALNGTQLGEDYRFVGGVQVLL
jgi:hypothetical protein